MKPEEQRRQEGSMWEVADRLCANSKLNATEYSMPVLGGIDTLNWPHLGGIVII